jgi:hypothetical protein
VGGTIFLIVDERHKNPAKSSQNRLPFGALHKFGLRQACDRPYSVGMALFKKRSPMEKMQQQLIDLRQRSVALSTKRAASEAALAEAMVAREKYMLEGDLADEQTAQKLQTKVDRCISTLAGFDAALAALQAQIAETEAEVAAGRAGIERVKIPFLAVHRPWKIANGFGSWTPKA